MLSCRHRTLFTKEIDRVRHRNAGHSAEKQLHTSPDPFFFFFFSGLHFALGGVVSLRASLDDGHPAEQQSLFSDREF